MSNRERQIDAPVPVARLPINSLPGEFKKPVGQFQRQALIMRKLPEVIGKHEENVQAIFEVPRQETPQETLTRLLNDPDSMEKLIDYYIIGAEFNLAQRRLEDTTSEVIQKATRGNKAMPPLVGKVVDTMLDVIDAVDFVDPFDTLPEGSPSLAQLAGANARTGEFSIDFSERSMEVQRRVRHMFLITGSPEQTGLVAFFVHLAKEGNEAVPDSKRGYYRSQGVSAETIHSVNQVGGLLDNFMFDQLYSLREGAYGTPYPARTELTVQGSYLPVALAHCSLSALGIGNLLPTSFRSHMENGFIPGLEDSVREYYIDKFTQGYKREKSDVLELTDNRGIKPYFELLERFDVGKSLDWLNELAPYYPDSPTIRDDSWEFFWESRRIKEFLKDKIISLPGDNRIASIHVGYSGNGMDMILLSPDNRALGLQLDAWGPGSVNVAGIPGGFVKESRELVNNIFSRSLRAVRREGYLDTPYPRSFESRDTARFREEQESKFRAKIINEDSQITDPTQKIEIHLPKTEQTPSEAPERSVGKGPKRFTIVVPEDIIEKAGLDDLEVEVLNREITGVEFSQPGTYPMRKMTGFKGDVRRISVRSLVTNPKGGKTRVNLRAIVEFDGTQGKVIKIATRDRVYSELGSLLK